MKADVAAVLLVVLLPARLLLLRRASTPASERTSALAPGPLVAVRAVLGLDASLLGRESAAPDAVACVLALVIDCLWLPGGSGWGCLADGG